MGFVPDIRDDEDTLVSVNLNRLVDDNVSSDQPKKRRGRPPKDSTNNALKVIDKNGVVVCGEPPNQQQQQQGLPMWQSNESYSQTYQPTTFLLYGVIQDIDGFSKDVREQIDIIKDSKTIRNKIGFVADLTQSASKLIDSKIRAIQEINSTITQGHTLDLRRTKELKMAEAANQQNDDKYIMDLYNAYINTPIGSYNGGPITPSMQDITLNTGAVVGIDMMQAPVDIGYAQYQANKSPEQNRMTTMATNPNIKTVVVYDQTTQSKRFDVVDTITGQSVPNMPLPNPAFLDDTTVNIANGVARNSNLDTVYPLVVVGERSSIDDY